MGPALWQPLLVFAIAAAVTWLLDRVLLDWFRRQQITASIRSDGPATHQAKAKTPALGGAAFPPGFLAGLIAGAVMLSANRQLELGSPERRGILAVLLLVVIGMFFLGFADDYLKVIRKSSTGLKARYRLPVQLMLGLLIGWVAVRLQPFPHPVPLPGLDIALLPSMLLIGWSTLFFAGTVNAVNFTDGLDTLLAGTGMIALIVLGGLCYGWFTQWVPLDPLLGHAAFAGAGALAGFYPHNRHPAKLFMGDGGAYFIGALFAALLVLQGLTFVGLLLGGVFYLELLSVMGQVAVFRASGGKRRLLPMAPLHHAFEVKGWPEERVVALFWGMGLASAVLAIIAARSVTGV